MDRERIKQASQLNDDLKKINRALELMDSHEKIAIRVSANVGGGNSEETLFAYLPKSIKPAIYAVLLEAQSYINEQMENL